MNIPDLTEKTLASERKYTGKIISVDLLDIELPDGRKAKREVIRHGNAVAVLAKRLSGGAHRGRGRGRHPQGHDFRCEDTLRLGRIQTDEVMEC